MKKFIIVPHSDDLWALAGPFSQNQWCIKLNQNKAKRSGYPLQVLAPVRFRSRPLWAFRFYPCPDIPPYTNFN
jgi:hypothetical protein